MYNDGFVLSIVTNGRTNREYRKDGKSVVHLPFGTEYAVRIKSKVSTRCKTDIFLDGTNISDIGSFIISPYGTMDIERFLGADKTKGRKFKFERLTHKDVQDPNSCENGLVEVYIYREKKVEPTYWLTTTSDVTYRSFGSGTGDITPEMYYNNTCDTQYCSSFDTSSMMTRSLEEGATVEGGVSHQQFVSVSGFEVEETPIILRLKIMGTTTRPVDIVEYCTRCGKKRHQKDNYCAKCGYKFKR